MGYREKIQQRIEEIGGHPSWGLPHCQRIYTMTMQLGGDRVDEEVIYTAAMLHDFGAYPEYRQAGVDHAVQSANVAGPFLQEIGFPAGKILRVTACILGHMFYSAPDMNNFETVVFHDADVLDFMGSIGIARLLAIVGTHDNWAPNLPAAIQKITEFSKMLPDTVITEQGKVLARQRQQEMIDFLDSLRGQTMEFKFV